MLYLNNPLLTSDLIIKAFKNEVFGKAHSTSYNGPSPLRKLKEKLKANFFNELVGCDLFLLSSSSSQKDIDLSILPKNTTVLLKQDHQYLIGRLEGNKWIFSELDASAIEETSLDFPAIGSAGNKLAYHTQHQRLYNHIKLKDAQINMNKKASDSNILDVIATDNRFKSEYLCLKYSLTRILSLTDTDDQTEALHQLEHSQLIDWEAPALDLQFKMLNSRYGYFKGLDEKKLKIIHPLFKEIATACRSMIVLFERNNNYNDTLAYEYAYKLMVLLISQNDFNQPNKLFDMISKETYKLLSQSEGKTNRPFHDALLVNLQLPLADHVNDLSGWVKLIKQEGQKVFPHFAIAQQIEQKIAELDSESQTRRAPTHFQEAEGVKKLCSYARAAEDLAFGDICNNYKVSEARFNLCLDYLSSGWPKKDRDSIPADIIIQGEGDAAGFYWVKLPTTDKRALILGDITKCCQSMGGESEACVRDGASLSDNGFYVMLQQRSGRNPAPIVDGKINDAHFDIVGQSYAWKSTTGNLCLDSIECRAHVNQPVIKRLITDFATQLLSAHADIKFVNVGCGGNTPKTMFNVASISEKMKQGTLYGDAATQYCIAKTPYHHMTESQVDALQLLLADYPLDFRNNIIYLSEYIIDKDALVEQLGTLLHQLPTLAQELTSDALIMLLALNNHPTLDDLKPIDFDELDRLSVNDREATLLHVSTARLLWRTVQKPEHLIRSLPYISKQDLFNVVKLMGLYSEEYSPMRDWSPTQRNMVYDVVQDRLPELIVSSKSFRAMMRLLTPEQCFAVCHKIKHRLQGIMTAYEFSQSFPSEHEKTAAISDSLAENLPEIIKSAYDFHWGTIFLTDAKKASVYTEMKDLIVNFIQSESDFNLMLASFYPDLKKTTFCVDVVDKLPEAVLKKYDVFKAMMQYLPEDRRAAFCQSQLTTFVTHVHSIEDLSSGVYHFPKEQRATIYETIKDKLLPMVQSLDDFFRVREHLGEAQRRDVYEALSDRLSTLIEQKIAQQEFNHSFNSSTEISDSDKLTAIIQRFSDKELLDILPKIQGILRRVMGQSFLVYQDVILMVPDLDKRQIIYEATQDLLIHNIKSAQDYERYSNGLRLEQALSLYDSLKEKFPDITPPEVINHIDSVDDFNQIMAKFSPKRRASFFEAWKDKLSDFIKSNYDLVKIKSNLTSVQRIELYTTMKARLRSILPSASNYFSFIGSSEERRIPLEEYLFLYEVMKPYLADLSQSSSDFRNIMTTLTQDQKAEFYEKMKGRLPNMIESFEDFVNIMENLTEEQGVEIYEEVKEKIANKLTKCNDFRYISQHIPQVQSTALFLEQKDKWLDRIQSNQNFWDLKASVASDHHQTLWNARLRNGLVAHINATVPHIDCKAFATVLVDDNKDEIKTQFNTLLQSTRSRGGSASTAFFKDKKLIDQSNIQFIDAVSSLGLPWLKRINLVLKLDLSDDQLTSFSECKTALTNYATQIIDVSGNTLR